VENDPGYVESLLQRTTHIWISHEHPDHFSPAFFKRYRPTILANGIRILFQPRRDRRVAGYLEEQGFRVIEPREGRRLSLGSNVSVRLVKSDFYDSALLMDLGGARIFNLNDCPLNDADSLDRFRKRHGVCDVLLTQFSYAAWKGGRANTGWRRMAALGKLRVMERQIEYLKARCCVPYASFVRFSNRLNAYMNDAVNTPDSVLADPVANKAALVFMRPGEQQPITGLCQDPRSLDF